MKLKELIKKYEEYENGLFDFGAKIACQNFLKDLQQLDEPKLVKVPQFVAEHIKRAKEIGRDLQDAMNSSSIHEEVDQWLYTDNNMDTFARAWLDGYEVEEEKRYRISMPKARNYMNHAQILCEKDGKIFWCGEWHPFRTKFTRKELEEAGFGWVFDCPGIEIEEVNE